MIELNLIYVKKVDGKGKVTPFKIDGDEVHFNHVGYLDWRVRTIKSFLEVYELETEYNGKD